jgi:hypothetical protein
MVTIASNGLSATLRGVPITDDSSATTPTGQPGPSEDCTHASGWQGSVIEGVPKYRDLRGQSCEALGAYKWSDDHFVHQEAGQ